MGKLRLLSRLLKNRLKLRPKRARALSWGIGGRDPRPNHRNEGERRRRQRKQRRQRLRKPKRRIKRNESIRAHRRRGDRDRGQEHDRDQDRARGRHRHLDRGGLRGVRRTREAHDLDRHDLSRRGRDPRADTRQLARRLDHGLDRRRTRRDRVAARPLVARDHRDRARRRAQVGVRLPLDRARVGIDDAVTSPEPGLGRVLKMERTRRGGERLGCTRHRHPVDDRHLPLEPVLGTFR